MSRNGSPLRYPGGKSSLHDVIANILVINKLDRGHYIEPYAGGCGLALTLLFNGDVSDVHINDIDISIWSFWHSIFEELDNLLDLILSTPVTIEEWHRQREIQLAPEKHSTLSLGFATFFLNRTNRSGIIKGAGAIGGLQQTGNYKIDCRFNKSALIERIKRIYKYRNRIHLSRLDALDFMKQKQDTLPDRAFFCIDPPYFNKGASLYTSFYGPEDHQQVAEMVLQLKRPWVVTYDNVPEISQLYKRKRQFNFDINYSLNRKRVGHELMIASSRLKIPANSSLSRTNSTRHQVA